MSVPIQRPCLSCRELTTLETRCRSCQAQHEAGRVRPHYRGSYTSRARIIRANAVECWLCGEGARTDDPWTADHVDPGNPESILLPAHRSCNSRRGDAKGKRAHAALRVETR